MRTEMFIKSYRADAAVTKHRLVKAGAADGSIAQSTLATSAIMGVADSLGGESGKVMDVICGGYATVEYGGDVTRGAPLTSDADGKAIVATVAGSRLIGYAVTAGAAGDLGTAHVQLGTLALGA
jgi:hypothetical protein